MNEDVKEKWIQALSSGEYNQGYGSLRRKDNSFCCLGVLCDLYMKETGLGEWEEEQNLYSFISQNSPHRAYLPISVQDWAGITGEEPRVNDGFLSILNDNGNTFTEIARIIEEQL